MRLLPGSLVSGFLVCVVACEDESSVPSTPIVIPPPNGFDAGPAPEAGPGVDAGPTVTTVSVKAVARYYEPLASQAPRAGVMIYAVSDAGALVATATTGADGQAIVELPNGGSITAVYPKDAMSNRVAVVTYVGVKPGESLVFGDRTAAAPPTGATGQFTVQWPALAGATGYDVLSPCQNSNTTDQVLTIGLRPDCQTPTAPLTVLAFDPNQNVIGSIYVPATAYTPGTSLTLTAAQWVTQAPTKAFGITMSGLPATVGSVDLQAEARWEGLSWSRYVGELEPTGGTVTTQLSMPGSATRTVVVPSRLRRNDYPGRQYHAKAGPAPVVIDVSKHPWVTAASASLVDHTVQWLESPGDAYDAATLLLQWRLADDTRISWRIALPPDRRQFDFNAFPAELAPFRPTLATGFEIGLRLVDLASTANYDAARAVPEWRLMDPENAVRLGDEASVAAADGGEGFSDFFY